VDCLERFTTYDRWKAAADRFNMRALLISQLGEVDGSSIWNAEALMHDVLAMLTLRPSDVRELVRQWRSLPKDRTLILQHHRSVLERISTVLDHRNVLAPLALVADLLPSSPDADLVREWLAVRLDFW